MYVAFALSITKSTGVILIPTAKSALISKKTFQVNTNSSQLVEIVIENKISEAVSIVDTTVKAILNVEELIDCIACVLQLF